MVRSCPRTSNNTFVSDKTSSNLCWKSTSMNCEYCITVITWPLRKQEAFQLATMGLMD